MKLRLPWRSFKLAIKLAWTYLRTHLRFFILGLSLSLIIIFLLPQILPRLMVSKPPAKAIVGNFTVTTLPNDIRQKLSFGLTKLTTDGSATAGAAVSWQATDSGKIVTFKLDDNLFWHDGTKFDASDVNIALRGVDLKKISLYEVELSLKEPFAPLPTVVSDPLFKNNFVGLGDYKIANIKFNGRFIQNLTLENVNSGSREIYKFYPTERDALTALKLGAVESVSGLHETFNIEADPRFEVATVTDHTVLVAVFFNLNQKYLEDKSVRQALVYALPDEFSGNDPALSPLSKSNWAYTDTIKPYVQNTTLAQKTLSSATDSGKVKLNIITSNALVKTAETLASAWQAVGVDSRVITSDVLIPSFDVYVTYIILPADPDQYALWHSTQKGNISNYRSFRVDRLLEEGRTTLDKTERAKIYSNFQKAIAEDVPATFLYYPKLYTITRK